MARDGSTIVELECGPEQERREVRIEVDEDGRVIISGAPEVDILYPYHRREGALEFARDGNPDGTFRVSAEMPGTAGDLQVMLIDEGRLLKKKPWQWSLTVEAEPIDSKTKGKMAIVARDGIGDWFQAHTLTILEPNGKQKEAKKP